MRIMIGALLCLCLLATANSFHINQEGTVTSSPTVSVDPVNYPVRFVYIDRFTSWWPPAAIAEGLAVPGYTLNNVTLPYNYVALAFWTYGGGPVDAALVWSNPLNYIGAGVFGDTKEQIQTTLKGYYAKAGVKLIISAFGATENPTSSGYDPVICATELAQFVSDNQLDGVDIDWEDTPAFQKGDSSGENWLITLTQKLRELLPANAIITHAPQAPYFTTANLYPDGGYLTVNKAVGSIIQFYNIQFYNQGTTMYQNADDIFNTSAGWAPETSVNEMIANGVDPSKIVIGKPATVGDASNSYMAPADIDAAIALNYPFNQWKTGVMFWQYSSDQDGNICSAAIKSLMSFHAQEELKEGNNHA
jgi:chitinase